MRIHYLQHVPFEGPAAIAGWAAERGYNLSSTALYAGEALPSPGDFDWLVIMGGPMGIYEEAEYPWLFKEKAFLDKAIGAGKTLIGVCLGAQLLADVLGARVYRLPDKEIGWFPITLTEAAGSTKLFAFLPKSFDVFHWHGDTFDLPQGSVHLASSAACVNQAFLYDGRVLGLQFHMESTPSSVHEIVANCGSELVQGPYIQSVERFLAAGEDVYQRLHSALFGILDRLPV